MKQELHKQRILHADETPYRVIDARNEKTHFWVYLSGKTDRYPIILYQHKLSRKHELPQQFLKDFIGYLHSDVYTAYGKLQNVKNAYCWAHVRRKFHEAIGSQPSTYSHTLTGKKYCNLLFKEEKNWLTGM